MDIIRSIKNHFANQVINLQEQKQHSIDVKNTISGLILAIYNISNIAYFFIVPSNFQEYIYSIYRILSGFICVTLFLVMIWKSETLFQFHQNLNNIIKKSKQTSFAIRVLINFSNILSFDCRIKISKIEKYPR